MNSLQSKYTKIYVFIYFWLWFLGLAILTRKFIVKMSAQFLLVNHLLAMHVKKLIVIFYDFL